MPKRASDNASECNICAECTSCNRFEDGSRSIYVGSRCYPCCYFKNVFWPKKNYVTLAQIKSSFYAQFSTFGNNPGAINAIIKKITSHPLNDSTNRVELLGNDDKGIVDFVFIAFKIFGSKTESILLLYFLILAISCGIFVKAFYRSLPHMFLLASILTLLYMVMPSIKYNPQLTSLMALRVFSILSIIASLHCVSFLICPISNKITKHAFWLSLLLVGAQIAIIFFTIHIRITTIWQLFLILGVAVYFLMVEGYKYWKIKHKMVIHSKNFVSITILCFILVGYAALKSHRFFYYPIEYKNGTQILTRVFWHNIFSGFAFHPILADKYQLRIDDLSVIDATAQYLKEKNELAAIGNIETYDMRWSVYDAVVRKMFIERCKQYPIECLETFFYYKPISFLGNIAWLYGLRQYPPDLDVFVSRQFGDVVKRQFIETTHLLDARHQRVIFYSIVPFLVLLAFLILLLGDGGGNKRDLMNSFKAVGLLFLGSLAPVIIGYPGAHTIAESAITFGAVIYMTIALLAYGVQKGFLCPMGAIIHEVEMEQYKL